MSDIADQQTWRHEHIPYRVRAAIARLNMEKSILGVTATIDPPLPNPTARTYWRCATDAIWEGQRTAARWLIEFVGVTSAPDLTPRRTRKRSPTDTLISDFSPGQINLFDLSNPDAYKLARFWKGCSQASSHATCHTAHPRINEPELSEAMTIIVDHLQGTIYTATGERIRDYVLE